MVTYYYVTYSRFAGNDFPQDLVTVTLGRTTVKAIRVYSFVRLDRMS